MKTQYCLHHTPTIQVNIDRKHYKRKEVGLQSSTGAEYSTSRSSQQQWPKFPTQIMKVSSVPFLINEVWYHFALLICRKNKRSARNRRFCRWPSAPRVRLGDVYRCVLSSSLRWWTGSRTTARPSSVNTQVWGSPSTEPEPCRNDTTTSKT